MSKFKFYQKNGSKDAKFLDKNIKETFYIGGTTIFVHKLLGVKNEDGTPNTNPSLQDIQDVLFLENRDRQYDETVIEMNGIYTIDDSEFNLSAFGLMFGGDSLFINFHLNDMLERVGRKITAGDVLEIEHRRDVLLDEKLPAINTFYVVKDAHRPSDGYSHTWIPHIWRTRVEQIKDSKEYADILNKQIEDYEIDLREALSDRNIFEQFNNKVLISAEKQVSKHFFDSQHLYDDGKENSAFHSLGRTQLNHDGLPNDLTSPIKSGTRFPDDAQIGDYFLRLDYKPNRLFVKENNYKWKKVEDNYRMKYNPFHQTMVDMLEEKGTFVQTDGEIVDGRQSLDKTITSKNPNQQEIIPED